MSFVHAYSYSGRAIICADLDASSRNQLHHFSEQQFELPTTSAFVLKAGMEVKGNSPEQELRGLARKASWLYDERYRASQTEHGWTEEKVRYVDELALQVIPSMPQGKKGSGT